MAKSIKLDADAFFDASNVAGHKGILNNGFDLNTLRYAWQSGLYSVVGSITNGPYQTAYGMLIVVAHANNENAVVEQILVADKHIYIRTRAGSPVVWGEWKTATLS